MLHLGAEAPADERMDHLDVLLGHPEDFGIAHLDHPRVLNPQVHRQPAPGVELRYAGHGLHVALVDGGGAVGVLRDGGGVREGRVRVAVQDVPRVGDVVLDVVNGGRVRPDRFLGVGDERELFVFDADQLTRLFRRVRVYGRDGGDFFAREADLVFGEDVLIGDDGAVQDVAGVVAGDDGFDAAELAGL